MLSFLNASLCSCWLVFSLTILLMSRNDKGKRAEDGYWEKEERRIRSQADQAGVDWGSKETKAIWIASLAVAAALYFLTGNMMLFGVGWMLMLVLPRLIIHHRKHRRRLDTLAALTDCLRQLLARLPDQGSLSRALEVVIESDSRGTATGMLRQVLEAMRLGSTVREAVGLWQSEIGMKKFDHVAETLIQANADGWTPAALKALEKSIEGLEGDLRAILLVAQSAVNRKKQLYLALATAWSFPLILSMMDTGGANLYLHTMPGKILIFAYVAVSLFIVVKGQEYLSLNVEEL
ncbi:MAG: hypothetical protein LBH09_00525 [Peptococcaceae bacterium]|jgi:pilus assembly protein TadC|nr:hypothetical protein [Peptococcaceae bacterium]